jgi:mannitol-1-/sugar-/sorbitol-6-/2-deoxyglucose-6-phosphatase
VLAYTALLFDMDGLMVDSEPAWFDLQSEFVRERGGTWTPELAHRCTGGGLPNALRVIREVFGFAIDVERDSAWMMDAFIARVEKLELKAGCAELVEAARTRGITRAVASSSTRRLVEATLRRFGLQPRFDAVVTGECVARAKPAPDIFLEAAARLGVRPEECVVLEDSLAGVNAARTAGMRVIAVPEKSNDGFAQVASAVVRDLHGARSLLGL